MNTEQTLNTELETQMHVHKKMTPTEKANDRSMTKTLDALTKIQDKLTERYQQTIKRALEYSPLSQFGEQAIQEALDIRVDIGAISDAEVLISNARYEVRVASGKRSHEELMELTGRPA